VPGGLPRRSGQPARVAAPAGSLSRAISWPRLADQLLVRDWLWASGWAGAARGWMPGRAVGCPSVTCRRPDLG